MRLTLRTMLAYLDEVLEPADQEDIGQKIEESEFASELVRRTRDVMRRLPLGAPQLSGRGMGLDSNTVAEYLDNTLPAERIADFERVCLESDVHLAEVSACHQILTLVLGQPAEIGQNARERMYAVLAAVEEQGEDSSEPTTWATERVPVEKVHGDDAASRSISENDALKKARVKPEVPEYLRESSRLPTKAMVTVFAVVTVLGAMAYLAFELSKRRRSTAFQDFSGEVAVGVRDQQKQRTNLGDVETGPAAIAGSGLSGVVEDHLGKSGGERPPDNGKTHASSVNSTDRTEEHGVVLSDEVSRSPALSGSSVREKQMSILVPSALLTELGKAQAEEDFPGGVFGAEPGSTITSGGGSPDRLVRADMATQEISKPPNTQLGVYNSSKDPLLRRDGATDTWWRLPPRAPLWANQELLALPTFRPIVALSFADINAELAGGTVISLLAADEGGLSGVDLHYGQVVFTNVGLVGSRCKLRLGDKDYLFGFGNVGATLAVQVRRRHLPGTDPEKTTAPIEASLFLARGDMHFGIADQEVEVKAPKSWNLPGEGPHADGPLTNPPLWFENLGELSQIEVRASTDLQQALESERSVNRVLHELVDQQKGLGRRSEIRSLVARSAVHVGQFEPFVVALRDKHQKSQWSDHIETLRNAMVLGPNVAGVIHGAFKDQLGNDEGSILFRMLWSYSDEDLQQGSDRQLVEYLEHDRLEFRVLAFWNLKKITGRGLNYRPEYSETRRRQSVRRWQKRLQDGQITIQRETL